MYKLALLFFFGVVSVTPSLANEKQTPKSPNQNNTQASDTNIDPLEKKDILGDFSNFLNTQDRNKTQEKSYKFSEFKDPIAEKLATQKQTQKEKTLKVEKITSGDTNSLDILVENYVALDTEKLQDFKPKKEKKASSPIGTGFLAIRPVAGKMTSRFGYRRIFGRSQFHKGLDIAAPIGTKVFATGAGTVSYSGWMRGYGRVVEINHGNGYKTRYAHNSRLFVKKGQHVSANQHISNVGCSGRCTGPHLHYEIRKNGKPLNPQHFINKAPQR